MGVFRLNEVMGNLQVEEAGLVGDSEQFKKLVALFAVVGDDEPVAAENLMKNLLIILMFAFEKMVEDLLVVCKEKAGNFPVVQQPAYILLFNYL